MKKVLLCIFLFPLLLKAQVPGYEGKRFIVSYNVDVLPNLSYIYSNIETPLPVQILFNNHLNAEYVLGRRFSLALDGAYSRNKIFMVDGNSTVSTGTYGLNIIFYPNHNNTLAPVGNYFKIRLFTGSASATGNIVTNNGTDPFGNNISVTTPEQTSLNINGFGIGFGNNMIINNHIVLTASVDLDYNVVGFNANKVPQGASYQELTYDVQSHILDSYLFYFKLGIGGLLF